MWGAELQEQLTGQRAAALLLQQGAQVAPYAPTGGQPPQQRHWQLAIAADSIGQPAGPPAHGVLVACRRWALLTELL